MVSAALISFWQFKEMKRPNLNLEEMPVFFWALFSANAVCGVEQFYRRVSITYTKIENQGNKTSKPSRQEGRELPGKQKYL